MGGLSNLVEFLSLNSLTTLAPLSLAASGAVVFGVWRSWAPPRLGLPALEPGLPPNLGGESQLARAGAEATPDADLLALSVPGGGE